MKRKKNAICNSQKRLVLVLFPLALIFALVPKGSLELWTNRFHHPAFDFFFYYWTNLGDAILYLALIPLLTMKRFSFGVFMALSAILQAIVIHICKRGIFRGAPRPVEYLEGIDFHQVPGLKLHHWNSFPSGHTATAMGIATALMIIFHKNERLRIFFLIAALLVAFSRVYLMQHFYLDVVIGSLVGIGCTWAAREITLKYFCKKIFRKSTFKTKSSQLRIRKIREKIKVKPAAA
jgi:membrane-associated phospholipid phosphatase